MNPDFWMARWREGRIGFHEGRTNATLARQVEFLGPERRVLVPLCGKAEDLSFLASRGHQVVGVELVRDAVVAFFAEHGLTPRVTQTPRFERFEAEGLLLLVGDFFALRSEDVGAIDALYDRAAMIALPSELRGKYVAKLRALLPSGAPGILVTVDYPQDQMSGPPFSVTEEEVRRHYDGVQVERVESQEWSSRGGEVSGHERCYRLTL